YLAVEESEQKEGYRLTIEKDGVRIVGGSARGLLYGVQTLRQILRQKGANLPFMEIEDCPQMANRGFYHDVTRGRVPKLFWLKKLAD
ncbi:glycoside hydrolase family 20 zincin-like fold domain-containing protein, partial [Acinetobacter baumannii]|nr:glycoside hydrolase family 20 zincin-like fold domain-containing protein [Acinetobacter baumannii]